MTEYQWFLLVLGALGFMLTWTGMVVGGTWALGKIKQEVTDKIAAESLARAQGLTAAAAARDVELDSIRKEFGETGHALRRFIEDVEKQMHEIELWGRDNYVQKTEFERIRDDIKDLISEVKNEFKEIRKDIATKH